MLLITVLLLHVLLFSAHSYERIADKQPSHLPPRNFLLLTKVMNRNLTDTAVFYAEFQSQVVRHNFSADDFAYTCLQATLEIKLSTLEVYLLKDELLSNKWLNAFVTNQTDELTSGWTKYAPNALLVFNHRKNFVERFTSQASAETKLFIVEIETILVDSLAAFLRTEAKQNEGVSNEDIRNILHAAVEQIAFRYKTLSADARVDLERSLCFGNVIRWLSFDWEESYKDLLEDFIEGVGLNINDLLKDNEYLASFPRKEVKQLVKDKAAKWNVLPQEYADMCAKSFHAMKLSKDELAAYNRSSEHFMGAKWGKQVYNKSEELIDVLIDEGAPFINIALKRWNFIKRDFPQPYYHLFLRVLEEDLLKALLQANNRKATDGKGKIKLLSWNSRANLSPNERVPEASYCLELTMQSILKQDRVSRDFEF